MNKIIFQIGLLAFCISTVAFSVFGSPLLEVIAKSFMVFIAAIIGMLAVLFASAIFSDKGKELEEAEKTGKAM